MELLGAISVGQALILKLIFWYQLCISQMPRLSQNLIANCNCRMQLLDSSVGVFAIASLYALFAVLSVRLLLLLHLHLPLPAFSIGECDSQCIVPPLPV